MSLPAAAAALPCAAAQQAARVHPSSLRTLRRHVLSSGHRIGDIAVFASNLNSADRHQADNSPTLRSTDPGQAAAVETWDFREGDRDSSASQRSGGDARDSEWDTGEQQWGVSNTQQNAASADWDTGADPWDTDATDWDAGGGQQDANAAEWDTGEAQWTDPNGSSDRDGGIGRSRGGGLSAWDGGEGQGYSADEQWDRDSGASSPSAPVSEPPPLDDRPLAATAQEELDEARKPFHRRLAQAAGVADVATVEAVLRELEKAGMQPGPRAYHVLVFAHTKAEQHEAAWHAATRAIAAGAVLLEETYILLILGHVRAGQVVAAQGLLSSMLSPRAGSEVDARKGWLVLTAALIRGSYLNAASQELLRGNKQGWAASADLYELMIAAACQQDVIAAKNILNRMQAEGVKPTMRHVHPILRSYAQGGAVELLEEELLVELYLSDKVEIDVECFNILIRGLIDTRDRGYGYEMMDKLRYTIPGQLKRAGLRPNARFYALQAEAHVDMDDFEHMREAGISFRKMGRRASKPWRKQSNDALLKRLNKLVPNAEETNREELIRRLRTAEADVDYAAGRTVSDTCPMDDGALSALLTQQALMAPEDLEKSLEVLWLSGWRLPEEAMQYDDQGLTLTSSWLRSGLSRLRSNRLADVETPITGSIDVEDISEAAFEDLGDVSREFTSSTGFTFTIDESGSILDMETGKVKAASKLTTAEILAELEARQLMTSGSRKEMYKRVQAARRAPAASLEATKLRERRMYQKYQSQRKRNEDTRAEARALREPTVDVAEMSGFGTSAGGTLLSQEAEETSALSLEPSLLGLDGDNANVIVEADEDADVDDDDDEEEYGRVKRRGSGSDDEEDDDLGDEDDDDKPNPARAVPVGATIASADEDHVRGGVAAETDALSAYDRMIESGGALMDVKHSRFIEHLQNLALERNSSKIQFSLPREETEWAARQLMQGTDTGMVILRHVKNLGGKPTLADIATLVQAAEAEEAYEYFGDLLSEVDDYLILEGDMAANEPPPGQEAGGLLTFAAAAGFSTQELEALADEAAEWAIAQDRAPAINDDTSADDEAAAVLEGAEEEDSDDEGGYSSFSEEEEDEEEGTASQLMANDDAYAMEKDYDEETTRQATIALRQLEEEGSSEHEGAGARGEMSEGYDDGEDFTEEDIEAALEDPTELTEEEEREVLDGAAELYVKGRELQQLQLESFSEAAWEIVNQMGRSLLQGAKNARTPERRTEVLQMAEDYRADVIANGTVLNDLLNRQLDYQLEKRDSGGQQGMSREQTLAPALDDDPNTVRSGAGFE